MSSISCEFPSPDNKREPSVGLAVFCQMRLQGHQGCTILAVWHIWSSFLTGVMLLTLNPTRQRKLSRHQFRKRRHFGSEELSGYSPRAFCSGATYRKEVLSVCLKWLGTTYKDKWGKREGCTCNRGT
eukprot:1157809-Pelagomonas_calceolata.AAC.17